MSPKVSGCYAWERVQQESGISSLPCRSASLATPGQVVNLRSEGAAHSQNSGQLQGDTPWKTKMIWGKIKLLSELLLSLAASRRQWNRESHIFQLPIGKVVS